MYLLTIALSCYALTKVYQCYNTLMDKDKNVAIWLHVNIRNGIPIYVQMIKQITHALEVGTLSPGDPASCHLMPPVLQASKRTSFSPNGCCHTRAGPC